jgi:hypothetical protein
MWEIKNNSKSDNNKFPYVKIYFGIKARIFPEPVVPRDSF